MLSRSAPVFYGDIRRHERIEVPFSTFIDLCKQRPQHKDEYLGCCNESEGAVCADVVAECSGSPVTDVPQQMYLAQVPILNIEGQEKVQLGGLQEDIEIPSFLQSRKLSSINLWMNNTHSRSSTHYDPHQNLLCIVHGSKQVVLWPPSDGPFLYLMPIYGEASNHSSVALDNPDYTCHPRTKYALNFSQKVILHEGDALFIPEGWFHQVDSDDLTIAVNFWWRSGVMSSMQEHMDAYYFRRLFRRDGQSNMLNQKATGGLEGLKTHFTRDIHENNAGQRPDILNPNIGLDDLAPDVVSALRTLVALVHNHVDATANQPEEPSSSTNSSLTKGEGLKKFEVANLYDLADDPVAMILWNLGPLTLQSVLLAMVNFFPRTLEALILHMLSPVGAEVLTRKFEEMDRYMVEDDRCKFYQIFYGVFDDHFSAADVILRGKEAFAHQAFKNVLDLHMGVQI